jgi:hypothetical protein
VTTTVPTTTTVATTTTVSTTTTVATTTTLQTTTTVATTTTQPRTTQVIASPPPPQRQALADISVLTVPPAGPAFFADSTPTYTTVVTNTGPDTATSVYLTVQPEGATVLASFASGGSCSGRTDVECTLGSLASGASAVLTVTLAPAHGSRRIVHAASAGATEPDPQAGNNSTRLETTVLPGHPGAPNLSTPGGAFQPPVFARRSGKAWVVATTVHLDEPARLSIHVVDAAGRRLTMLPGTLINYLPANRPHTVIPHTIDGARWVPLQLRLQAAPNKAYRIVAEAIGPDGGTAGTTIHFRT